MTNESLVKSPRGAQILAQGESEGKIKIAAPPGVDA
jgi:hypothetical protein